MEQINTVIEKVKKGFESIDVSSKYKDSALKNLEEWLTDDMFKEYVTQIEYLIEKEMWDFIMDAFYQVISFGTGGRRGLVGIGPNRINKWTIQASAQGHSQYLIKEYGEEAKTKGVVLDFDVRVFSQKGVYNDNIPNPVMNLNCKDLAIAAAEVYSANGIKTFMFDGPRSTPELSFAIRHLKAIAGDMFSASHNLPTDNGKKVYDIHGGQLIPPHDQNLVDEVTKNVAEIKTMDFEKAKSDGLIEMLTGEVDEAFFNKALGVSLSDSRDLKIVFSPLHGTGLTSVYPVLKKAGFEVLLDPKTSNLSGAFENVTFNIPNPEVIQSFDTILPFAKESNADIIVSTDPDADRVGIMVNHKGDFEFINGNELGIILTNYGIEKIKAKGELSEESVVIKTEVTNSLIQKIADKNNVKCIGDLLVGFKYIGNVMNQLEAEGKIDKLILGAEESHGYIMGNYSRDKDAACAAVWLCELAAELKKDGKTLVDYLDEIYSQYGYCHNYLTEIRLLGAKGMDQIQKIMNHMREKDFSEFGRFKVREKLDRLLGEPQPHLSITDTASRNVLVFNFDDVEGTEGIRAIVRPSGTEPKVKMYVEIIGKPFELSMKAEAQKAIVQIREELEKILMKYFYGIIDVDFPDRGFLLFWQLPLVDKMKYFDIEDDIVALKGDSDWKQKLDKLLDFLGANPVEKIDDAFKAKYEKGIIEYLSQ